MKIGYQDVKGAFSYIASKTLYPHEQLINFQLFYDVFEALENSKIDIGIIPIENSYTGKIDETNKLLHEFKVNIINTICIPIHHNLAGVNKVQFNEITHIFSHKQALLQCSKTLKKILPKAQLVEKENTAISANFISNLKNKHYTCICSNCAIKEFNLKKLYPNIQDENDNYTLFISISK